MKAQNSPFNEPIFAEGSWQFDWYRKLARYVLSIILIFHAYCILDLLQIALETGPKWSTHHASKDGQGPIIFAALLLLPIFAYCAQRFGRADLKSRLNRQLLFFGSIFTTLATSAATSYLVATKSVWYLAFGLAGAGLQFAILFVSWQPVFGKKPAQ